MDNLLPKPVGYIVFILYILFGILLLLAPVHFYYISYKQINTFRAVIYPDTLDEMHENARNSDSNGLDEFDYRKY